MTSPSHTVSRPPSRLRRLTRALVYAAGTTLVVTLVGTLVRDGFDPLIHADQAFIVWATDITRAHPGLRSFLIFWQEATQPWRLYILGTLVCLYAAWRGLRSRALWAFLTMMVSWNVALDAKLIWRRARPVVQDPVSHAPGYSFPSGHAANAAAFTTAVLLLLWPLLSRAGRRIGVALGTVLVVGTALDRNFLGVHFPSDVWVGVVLGCGLVAASYLGWINWSPAKDERTVPADEPGEISEATGDAESRPAPTTSTTQPTGGATRHVLEEH